jgi:hypothetical protein
MDTSPLSTTCSSTLYVSPSLQYPSANPNFQNRHSLRKRWLNRNAYVSPRYLYLPCYGHVGWFLAGEIILSVLWWCSTHQGIKLCCGLTLTAFEPVSPAVTPTPESVIQSAKHTKSEIIQCVPSFAEVFSCSGPWLWYSDFCRRGHSTLITLSISRRCDALWVLADLDRDLFTLIFMKLMGGGSMNKEVGDSLVKLGVPICIGYGRYVCDFLTMNLTMIYM